MKNLLKVAVRKRLVRQGENRHSWYLRRQGVVQRSERQDDDASAGHRWCYKESASG